MTVQNVRSSQIANRDATPSVASNSRLTKAPIFEGFGVGQLTIPIFAASTIRITSIPSNARISQVLLSSTALGGTTAADVGLYQTTDNGGAVVDADFFASAVSLVSALANSDITRESGVVTVANMELPVWQALGLAADPIRDYDVVVTLTVAATSSGQVQLSVRYTV
jgi:hypothetical protein